MDIEKPIVTNERYVTTIEILEKYGARTTHLEILIELGKVPSVKDYIDLFREQLGVETEIKDINTMPHFDKQRYYLMDFRVLEGATQELRGIRVLRTSKDFTYTPVTKI
ncbi:hypothetical protein [Paenibacillus radicis (ex Xue et al. 2023)]|uniref:Uncharacterized protein n=1 Tax=Paenibacillus radicis (ex Xue et al. 2023) TaxID=2972489 RepID=A0ABT1YKF1_9BACL|nr:hypothetical protein [Paenibacillus radicis (ex Xue et al. 2023)]MCR8633661.1 hypothetical protein [Paenibacillus radicis (ex Xue et al. 2023)]